MKFSLFFFAFCVSFSSRSQLFLVIDKSEQTKQLFDEADPYSFISIVKNNRDFLAYFNKVGISEADFNLLSSTQQDALFRYYGPESVEPVMDDDPNSPNFGSEVIHEDPETGVLSFVYPPADTLYTDFEGITRIMVEYKPGEEEFLDRVTSVRFCKKYTDQYVSVLNLPGNDVLTLDGFEFFSPVDSETRYTLLNGEADGYGSRVKDSLRLLEYTYDYRFFPTTFDAWRGSMDQHMPKPVFAFNNWDIKQKDYFRWEDWLKEFPFDCRYGDSMYYVPDFMEQMQVHFDTVVYDIYFSDIPLIEEDPDSPNFGSPMVVYDENGNGMFLYSAPDYVIRWVEFDPKLYVVFSFIYEDGLRVQPDQVFFVEDDEGLQHAVLQHLLTPEWRVVLSETLITFDWSGWYANLQGLFQSGRKLNPSKLKKRKQFNMSVSFWEEFDVN